MVAHFVRQALAPHAYPAQGTSVPAWQEPPVPQRPANVATPPVQLSVPHTVPAGYLRQPPDPSQAPSPAQLVAPSSLHCMSGSWPAGTFVQVPALEGSAHDLQVPVHAVLQQTPCSHSPELHSGSLPHVAPMGFFPQLPWMQLLPAMQSASIVQVVPHCPLLSHWNGAQEVLVALSQVPLPSQRPAVINIPFLHPAAWQMVPVEYFWHAPAPSHWPVFPQLGGPFVGAHPARVRAHVGGHARPHVAGGGARITGIRAGAVAADAVRAMSRAAVCILGAGHTDGRTRRRP